MLQAIRAHGVILQDLAPRARGDDAEASPKHPRDVQTRLHDADDGDIVQLPQRIDQRVFTEARDEDAVEIADRLVVRGGVFREVAEAGFCAEDGVGGGFDGGGGGDGGRVPRDFDGGGKRGGEGVEHGGGHAGGGVGVEEEEVRLEAGLAPDGGQEAGGAGGGGGDARGGGVGGGGGGAGFSGVGEGAGEGGGVWVGGEGGGGWGVFRGGSGWGDSMGGFAVAAGGAGVVGRGGAVAGLRGEWVGHWFGRGAHVRGVVVVAGEAGGV